MKINKGYIKKFLIIYFTFTFAIFIWELSVFLLKASPIVIVKPSEIYPVIFNNSELFINELMYTLVEVLIGWSISFIVSFLLASLIFNYSKLTRFILSISIVINAVPLIALSAIIGGFLGTDQFAKIVIVIIVCFFPLLISLLVSFKKGSEIFYDLSKSYYMSLWQKYTKCIFPYSLSNIFTSLKITIVLAISTAVVSEFFGAHGGIGQFILSRKGFYDLPMVWGAIFYLLLAGFFIYFFLVILKKIFVRWEE